MTEEGTVKMKVTTNLMKYQYKKLVEMAKTMDVSKAHLIRKGVEKIIQEYEQMEATHEILEIPGAYEGIMEGKAQIERGEFVNWKNLKKKKNT